MIYTILMFTAGVATGGLTVGLCTKTDYEVKHDTKLPYVWSRVVGVYLIPAALLVGAYLVR